MNGHPSDVNRNFHKQKNRITIHSYFFRLFLVHYALQFSIVCIFNGSTIQFSSATFDNYKWLNTFSVFFFLIYLLCFRFSSFSGSFEWFLLFDFPTRDATHFLHSGNDCVVNWCRSQLNLFFPGFFPGKKNHFFSCGFWIKFFFSRQRFG